MRIQCPFCMRTYGAARDCGILVGSVKEAVIKCRCGKVLNVHFALAPKDTTPEPSTLRRFVARVRREELPITRDPASTRDPVEIMAIVEERDGTKGKLGTRYPHER